MNHTRLKRYTLLAGLLLILAGSAVRWADLARHFTHVDDVGVAYTLFNANEAPPLTWDNFEQKVRKRPHLLRIWRATPDLLKRPFRNGAIGQRCLLSLIDQEEKLFEVPKQWTYAPAQFFITPLLIRPEQSYRDILFWGRLPSFVFGVLGLAMILVFFRVYDRFRSPSAVCISLTIMAFSWEHIIYSKQMMSYTIGVFSAIVLIALLIGMRRTSLLSKRNAIGLAAVAALLGWTHYQILFLAPAFFLTLLAAAWNAKTRPRAALLRNFAAGMITFGLLVLPLYVLFLRHHLAANDGVNIVNSGPHGEFLFSVPPAASFIEKTRVAVAFFVKNSLIVIGAMTAFVPEKSHWAAPCARAIQALLLLGAASLVRSRRPKDRSLALFFALSAVTWVALVIAGRMAFCPTRNSLILLPYMAILIARGWGTLAHFFRRMGLGRRWVRYGPGLLIATIVVLFFLHFQEVSEKRSDPIDENRIASVLERYQVRTVLSGRYFLNVLLMKQVRTDRLCMIQEITPRPHPKMDDPYKTFAWIGQWDKLNETTFEMTRDFINDRWVPSRGEIDPKLYLRGSLKDYRILYSEEIDRGVATEFSDRTVNGTNSLNFYVLERVSRS